MTRSVIIDGVTWDNAAAAGTISWRWRQFSVERPYEQWPVSACSLVRLALERGHCAIKAERIVRCPRNGVVRVDLEQSDAEPPQRPWR